VTRVPLPFPEGASFLAGDGLLERFAELIVDRGIGSCFVVSDTNVGPLYARALAERLDAPLMEVPAGETAKSWPSADVVARFLLVNGATRGDLVVAVGGGVVTDLAGFVASIVHRGVTWAACPTTLLGMVDASIGGKTGVNLDLGKNLLGTFWPPLLVVADTATLGTLPLRELRNGLAEVIKTALIAPATLELNLDSHIAALSRGKVADAQVLVSAAARVKADVVSRDERERGPRRALNLGHTLGHAFEAATGYSRLLHGEAVAWGLLACLRLARDRGLMPTEDARGWLERLQYLAPLPSLAGLSWDDVAPFVHRDKKRTGDRVGWVLPRRGGVVLDVDVTDDEARAIFADMLALPDGAPLAALL
jgi:3-dehydroquinate synthase